MITSELIQQTEGRFAERQSIRQEREAKIRSGALLEADSPDRVLKRVQHLARMEIETEGVGLPAPDQAQGPGLRTLERIIGKTDLMSVRFLELGSQIARTVGRIHVRRPDGNVLGYGTGFLVSPRLLLTNNHVLTDAGVAAPSRVEFDFQEGVDGRLQSSIFVNLDPEAFFATDKPLDFSVVALKGDVGKVASYGWNGLSAAEGKIIVGEYVTIIQHPGGKRKQLALRDNQVVDVLDTYLHYRTDTSPGSSGSPVFNDQWEVVGLHHSGVPKKDAQGRILARDGRVFTSSMGEDEIDWIANEGVRISQILRHVQGLSLSGERAMLRKQLLDSEKGWQAATAASKEVAMNGPEAGAAGSAPASAVEWLLGSTGSREVAMNGLEAGAAGSAPASAVEWLLGSTGSREVAMNGLEAEATGSAPTSAVEWLVGSTNGGKTGGF
jgi:endonuclease G